MPKLLLSKDSDEEILERILDLPLQKHCSKKLFSIPEVTEEEDEEENPTPSVACKASHCNVEIPKCHYVKAYKAFPQKAAGETCANLSTDRCCRDVSGDGNKVECSVDDCVFQDWQQRAGGSISQSPLYSVKSCVAENTMWNAKKNSSVNERTHCVTESNRKKQSEGREHCSRLSSNANPAALYNSRGHDVKETIFSAATRETSQGGHKNIRVSRSYQKRQPIVPTNVVPKSSTYSSRHLEIDIEYDTEDEDDMSVPTYYATRNKADIWEDSSQTDREGWSESSDYSEPIRVTRRKEMKRQPKVQTGTDCLKRHTSLLNIDRIHGGQHGSNKEDQGNRPSSTKTMRRVRWEGAGKGYWTRIVLDDLTVPATSGA
ncbi:peripheral-type benzodiazepine receptor-associated protein 1-like [Mantella aurantiaca]